MSRIWKSLLMVAPVVLGACGGGGGDSGGAGATAAAAPPVNRLAAYVGNWRSACVDGVIQSSAVSLGAQPDTLSAKMTIHYHWQDKACQRPAIAIHTDTVSTLLSYAGSESAKVQINGEILPALKVDKVRTSTPPGSPTVTGPDMRLTDNSNGGKLWCDGGLSGSGFCLAYPPEVLHESTKVHAIVNGKFVWAENQTEADGSYRGYVMTRQP